MVRNKNSNNKDDRASVEHHSSAPAAAAAAKAQVSWGRIAVSSVVLAALVAVAVQQAILALTRTTTTSKEEPASSSSTAAPASTPASFEALPSSCPPTEAVTPNQPPASESTPPVPRIDVETKGGMVQILERVPHDASAFTQGLQLHPRNASLMYESTGLYGSSEVRVVYIPTGQVLQKHTLEAHFFGEGLTYYGDDDDVDNNHDQNNEMDGRLIQVTWMERTGFVYNASDLRVMSNFSFSTTRNEGWGITYRRPPAAAPRRRRTEEESSSPAVTTITGDNRGRQLVVSDGSEYLHFWDADTMSETRPPLPVHVQTGPPGGPVSSTPLKNLNELEWDMYTDTIYANVWYQDHIARINPDTGLVITMYDLSDLYVGRPHDDVLNGIALTDTPNELWVTGKLWPSMFRIRLMEG